MTSTGHYGWTHRRCAERLSTYDDALLPACPKPEPLVAPKVEYRCHGITGQGEPCTTKPQVRRVYDPEAVHYCGRHKRQRPEGSREIPAKEAWPEGWVFPKRGLVITELEVKGETFCDGYPDNLYRIRKALFDSDGHPEGPAVVLRRNPNNSHDANAVEVHVPLVGGPIGHLSREHAAKYAPLLDAGLEVRAYVGSIGVHDEKPEHPGAWVHLVDVWEMVNELEEQASQ